ncbi:MAG: maleylpyruvate isomerase family mycothiol-dependent enzyme [Actinomycetota bacterium]|nr:MAG: maleylpyruvate isomerase family mycothiol-dependent enzyme [Actinomycetota bacterium]
MRLAYDERSDLAAFLATLTPQQWRAPTLCSQWRVRDVVAHVICYDVLGWRGLPRYMIQGRLVTNRVNAASLADYDRHDPEELLALLERHLQPHGLSAALGGRVALVEGIIHHQDIRRGLGVPRIIPAERLMPALRWTLIAPDIGSFWRIRGLRLVATDLDWSTGIGSEVRGEAEALLMAIAGRRGVVEELTGPGQAKLAARINGQ